MFTSRPAAFGAYPALHGCWCALSCTWQRTDVRQFIAALAELHQIKTAPTLLLTSLDLQLIIQIALDCAKPLVWQEQTWRDQISHWWGKSSLVWV